MERYDNNKRINSGLNVLKPWVDRCISINQLYLEKQPQIYVFGIEGFGLEVDKYVVYSEFDMSWYRVVLCLLDEDDVEYCDMMKNGDYIGYAQDVYGYGDYGWKWSWGVVEDANI